MLRKPGVKMLLNVEQKDGKGNIVRTKSVSYEQIMRDVLLVVARGDAENPYAMLTRETKLQ